jgi:hypothetical protein
MTPLLSRQRRDSNEAEIVELLRNQGALYIYMDKSAGFDGLVAQHGKIYLVEIKSLDGRLSPAEQRIHDMLAAHGVKVHILRSQSDAIRMLIQEEK